MTICIKESMATEYAVTLC